MESIFVLRNCNIVEHWNIENGSIIKQIVLPDIKTKLPHKYTGLYHFTKQNPGKVMVGNNFGDVSILPFDDVEGMDQKPDPIYSFNVGKDMEAIRVNFLKESELAAGGEKQLLRLWDIETGNKTWNEKNLRDNAVRLAPPV